MRPARAATKEKSDQLKREHIAIVKCEEDGEELPEDDRTKLDQLMDQIGQHEETLHDHNARIERMENALQFEKAQAKPVETTEGRGHQPSSRRSEPPPAYAQRRERTVAADRRLCRTLVADGGTV